MPTRRHLVLARDVDHAAQIAAFFENEFAMKLKPDYMSSTIGERLGVVALPFFDDRGVRTSSAIVEAADIDAARRELPEIRLPSDDRSQDTYGPIR